MGFFQDLKQDLSQAVNEVSSEELELEETDAAKEQIENSQEEEFKGLEAMLEQSVEALGVEAAETVSTIEEDVVTPEVNDVVEEEVMEDIALNMEVDKLLDEVEQNLPEESFMEPEYNNISQYQPVEISNDTAVITAGMVITGDITSTGNMDLVGVINGNIDIHGKLNVTGSINGNSSASEIYAESAQINGEVKSKGSVKIGQSSVVIGNIFATSAVIAGAVKGDIDVHGPVILDTSAIVMGNIKSKSVQINNGAVIEGMCSQCYADVSPTSFFNEVKKGKKAM